jgi:hypothetical protein
MQYAVFVRDDTKWKEVLHWRDITDDAMDVTIAPRGLGARWKDFPEAVWAGKATKADAKGRRGRQASGSWEVEDEVAVFVMRAHGVSARVPGSGPARDVLLASFANGVVSEAAARACLASADLQLRVAALGESVLRVAQIGALARSTMPQLRATAARHTTDTKTLDRLLMDDSRLVQSSAVRNPLVPAALLTAFSHDRYLAYDVALNENADDEFLKTCIRSGELPGRAAMVHPKMAELANYALMIGSPNEAFAAANPLIDEKVALHRARERAGVASSLARNAAAVSRLSCDDSRALLDLLQVAGDRVGVVSAARHATLSEEDQISLLDDPLMCEAVGAGLAGNVALTDEAAEMLVVAAEVFEPETRVAALVALGGNQTVPSRVLARVPIDDPRVARALRSNPTASGSVQQRARERHERAVTKNERLMRAALKRREAFSDGLAPARVITTEVLKPVERALAVVALRTEVLDNRIPMHPSWGIQAWGAEVFEASCEVFPDGFGGSVAETVVVMRVNEKKMAETAGANPRVDPLALCIIHNGEEHFTLLEPLGKRTGLEASAGAISAGDLEDISATMRRHLGRIDWKSVSLEGIKSLPGVGDAAKLSQAAKKLVQVEAAMLGTPRGADRVARVRTDISDGSATMRVLAAEFTRETAVGETEAYVRGLRQAGVLTEEQSEGALGALLNLDAVASLASDRRSWAWSAREKLRFRLGQREVVEALLAGDVPWEFEELFSEEHK